MMVPAAALVNQIPALPGNSRIVLALSLLVVVISHMAGAQV
jgi:hypothetical protein